MPTIRVYTQVQEEKPIALTDDVQGTVFPVMWETPCNFGSLVSIICNVMRESPMDYTDVGTETVGFAYGKAMRSSSVPKTERGNGKCMTNATFF